MHARSACWGRSASQRPARVALLGTLEQQLGEDRLASEQGAGELTSFATREAAIQAELKEAGQAVTDAEVAAQRARDHAGEAELELAGVLRAPRRRRGPGRRTPPSRWTRRRSRSC